MAYSNTLQATMQNLKFIIVLIYLFSIFILSKTDLNVDYIDIHSEHANNNSIGKFKLNVEHCHYL